MRNKETKPINTIVVFEFVRIDFQLFMMNKGSKENKFTPLGSSQFFQLARFSYFVKEKRYHQNSFTVKNKWIYLISLLYFVLGVIICFSFDGTGGSGDSYLHYQFAKYAPQHLDLFFNHWAKPVFVLLASPFAQFGIIGIKIFNVIVTSLTLIFTYWTAKKLTLKSPLLSSAFLIFAPFYFTFTFSGFTEPLFALFLSISIFSFLSEKFLLTCILVSFLPFVRSEGLIFIGVFVLLLLVKKQYKLIPFLAIGHIVYSILGYFIHKDFLWVFTKIPYSKLGSTYGNGDLFHFVDQLLYVIGTPIYVLLAIGIITIFWAFLKKKVSIEGFILIFIGFWAFFIAHSLFWYLGIFNSMGLKRVMICIMPLISILVLIGYNSLTENKLMKSNWIHYSVKFMLIGTVFIFPFTPNHGALKFKEFKLLPDQELICEIGKDIKSEKGKKYLFSHSYLNEILRIDPFDKTKCEIITKVGINNLKKGDLIIWDNWFSVVENGITQEYLNENNTLIKLKEYSANSENQKIVFAVYEKQ